jgi:hypothetical protein
LGGHRLNGGWHSPSLPLVLRGQRIVFHSSQVEGSPETSGALFLCM